MVMHETAPERTLRVLSRVVVIGAAVFGTPLACYLASVGGGAWAYNTLGPGAGDIAAVLAAAAVLAGAVLAARWLLQRIG
ncbi:MAG: hypothetical protein F4X11_19635 [Acidobacteria bacterium]|nr:hypothetical protein [Acidobacteriota bacterium]